MAQAKRIGTESPFGFKNESTKKVFRNVVLRVLEAIRDCERSLKPGETMILKSMELHIEVDKPTKRKKKKK